MKENKLLMELGLIEMTDFEKAYKNPNSYTLKKVLKKDQTYDLVIRVIDVEGSALQYVSKKLIDENLCIRAVKQDGMALKYVPEKYKNETVCRLAVLNNGRTLRDVPKRLITKEMAEIAIKQFMGVKSQVDNRFPILYVPTEFIDEQMLMDSVSYTPHSIYEILLRFSSKKLITEKLILRAISKDGTVLKHIAEKRKDFLTKDIVNQAIKQNVLALEFVPEDMITLKMCELCMERDIKTVKFIPHKYHTKEMFDKAIEKDIVLFKYVPQKFITFKMCEKAINSEYFIVNSQGYMFDKNRIIFSDIPEIFRSDKRIIDLIIVKGESQIDELLLWSMEKTERDNQPIKPLESSIIKYLKDLKENIIKEKGNFVKHNNKIFKEKYNELLLECIPPYALTCEEKSQDVQVIHNISEGVNDKKIYYISDIHIEYQFIEYCKKNEIHDEDIFDKFMNFLDDKIYELVRNIDNEGFLLISGDIANSEDIALLFYEKISSLWRGQIIITLGNHELWDGNNIYVRPINCRTVDEIVDSYKKAIVDKGLYNIHIIHNELYILYKGALWKSISEQQIIHSDIDDLKQIMDKSSMIFFGGVGFSGLNTYYNASKKLYLWTVDLKEDKIQTDRFSNAYMKVLLCAKDKNVIVLTHTQLQNWTINSPNPRWIYINGHTHRNNVIREKDGTTILSDNQVGYELKKWKLNSFTSSGIYDPFDEYKDGIYKITSEEYKDFNNGRGIFNNGCNYSGDLYMLKKSNVYMFVLKTKHHLNLMAGGMRCGLENEDINYYFDNMLLYYERANAIIKPYQSLLKSVSYEIKKIGGIGTMHGCIVDISELSHIYINPYDGKITAYWAENTLMRVVYTSIQSLIEQREPALYDKYIEEKSTLCYLDNINQDNTIDESVNKDMVLDIGYDIYSTSKIIRAIQYIEDNVIRIWNEKLLTNGENWVKLQVDKLID